MALRLFTGFELPPQAQEAARLIMENDHPNIRWTAPENLHLTSYFFGKWEEEALANLISCIDLVVPKHKAFTLKLKDIVLAPTGHEARMIWARYHRQNAFTDLSLSLANMFQRVDPDHQFRKKPIPHITLARLQHWKTEDSFVPNIDPIQWQMPCKKLILWKSELGENGPRYTQLSTWSLRI